MTSEEMEELKGLAASMGLYDDKSPCKRAMILGKAIKELEREPCEDCVSRQAVIDIVNNPLNIRLDEIIKKLPPVTPQSKTGYCKKCKYFEHDSVAKVDGIPLIVAHEICSRWGNGCKTKEDGYCFLFEPQEESEAQEALDTALNALDEVEKYKKTIEEIKAEILSLKGDNFPNGYYVKIIDKHIKGVKS